MSPQVSDREVDGVGVAGPVVRGIFGAGLGGLLMGGGVGFLAFAVTSSVLVAGGAGLAALLYTWIISGSTARSGYSRAGRGGGASGGWGTGGGWGGGSSGSGGGGFSSGGGGASAGSKARGAVNSRYLLRHVRQGEGEVPEERLRELSRELRQVRVARRRL